MAPIEWIAGTVPKIGNRAEENEDATNASADGLRFGIADGATEGWESGPWATHLTAAFINAPPTPATFAGWLAETRRAWVPKAAPGPLPWYATVKQQEGSFATVAGLEIRRTAKPPGWGWRSVAVGDSCLLHLRGEKLLAAFPHSSPAAFGNRPRLVPSAADVACPEPEWLAGRAAAGDLFLLATDAVAAQLLHPHALKVALVAVRESLRTRNPESMLAWLRTVQATTNDDASLIGIRLPAPEEVR
ncbi:MAG: hypothetical protein C0467_28620 [Planctomycetaceae bacterium]|nr:hypothetical protein [Planctomycetaceae bacterium]